MKITIEWQSSYEAHITIDDKPCSVQLRQGAWKLEGLTDDEIQNTIGGKIASVLLDKVSDFMQAEAGAMEIDDCSGELGASAWTPLSEAASEAFSDRCW